VEGERTRREEKEFRAQAIYDAEELLEEQSRREEEEQQMHTRLQEEERKRLLEEERKGLLEEARTGAIDIILIDDTTLPKTDTSLGRIDIPAKEAETDQECAEIQCVGGMGNKPAQHGCQQVVKRNVKGVEEDAKEQQTGEQESSAEEAMRREAEIAIDTVQLARMSTRMTAREERARQTSGSIKMKERARRELAEFEALRSAERKAATDAAAEATKEARALAQREVTQIEASNPRLAADDNSGTSTAVFASSMIGKFTTALRQSQAMAEAQGMTLPSSSMFNLDGLKGQVGVGFIQCRILAMQFIQCGILAMQFFTCSSHLFTNTQPSTQ
jgi:hypothetical protein